MVTIDDFNRSEANTSNSTGPNGTQSEPYLGAASILSNLSISVPTILTYAVCFLLGTVGNVLVVFSVARFRRLRSTTNYLLGNLATADLLIVALCVPVKAAEFFLPSWQLGGFLCKATALLQFLSVICSVLTLTCISLERYYGILHPMKARTMFMYRKSRRTAAAVWLLSLVLASPSLLVQGLVKYDWGTGDTIYHCQQEWTSRVYHRLYVLYGLLILFVLPVVIMGFSYGCVIREIVKRRRGQNSGNKNEETISPRNTNKLASSFRQCSERLRRNLNPADEVEPAVTSPQDPRVTSAALVLEPVAQRNTDEISSACRTPKCQVLGDENGLQIIKMLVVVMVVFAVCWGPLLTLHTLVTFDLLDEHTQQVYAMRIAFHLLSYTNSCANPVCYAFMSRSFRKSFGQTIATWYPSGKCRLSSRRRKQPTPGRFQPANVPIPVVFVERPDEPSLAECYSMQRTQGTPLCTPLSTPMGTPLSTPDKESRGTSSIGELDQQMKSVDGALEHVGVMARIQHENGDIRGNGDVPCQCATHNILSFVTSV